MRANEITMIQEKLDNYDYTSMRYCDFDGIKDYDLICNTNNLLLIRGFNPEAKSIEYHWASNQASDVIREKAKNVLKPQK